MSKKSYIGVPMSIPHYNEGVILTSSNISGLFSKTDGTSDYFTLSGSTFTAVSTTGSRTFTTTLTALVDMWVSFDYSYSYSNSWSGNYLTISKSGETIVTTSDPSGTGSVPRTHLNVGDTLVFTANKSENLGPYISMTCTVSSIVCETFSHYTEEGRARKIKKWYYGVDGKARFVKKGYIGIGGKARPFLSARLEYYGTTTALSNAKYQLAATTVGNYALFGGGGINEGTSYYSDTLDAYDSSLIKYKGTISTLSTGRRDLAATTVGDYALFAGGENASEYSDTLDAYDSSLIKYKGTISTLGTGRNMLAATTVGDYAVFGGGNNSGSSGGQCSTVDAYDSSLTKYKGTISSLSAAKYSLAATTVGDYALFAGGHVGTGYSSVVDAYDASLTKYQDTISSLSAGRIHLAATTVGDYALFAGGYRPSSVVDAYGPSLTKYQDTISTLSEARYNLAATTVGDYAIFGGGNNLLNGTTGTSVVDIYDTSLARSIATSLNKARCWLAATTVGNYALFGGGFNSSDGPPCYTTVDVYMV